MVHQSCAASVALTCGVIFVAFAAQGCGPSTPTPKPTSAPTPAPTTPTPAPKPKPTPKPVDIGTLFVGGGDKVVALDGTTLKAKVAAVKPGSGNVLAFALDPTTKTLFVGSGKYIAALDATSLTATKQPSRMLTSIVRALALPTANRLVASVNNETDPESVLYLLNTSDLRGKEELKKLKINGEISAFALEPETNTLYVGTKGSVVAVDAKTLEVTKTVVSDVADVSALAFEPDTKTLFVATAGDDMVTGFDTSRFPWRRSAVDPGVGSVSALALGPANTLFVGGDSGVARLSLEGVGARVTIKAAVEGITSVRSLAFLGLDTTPTTSQKLPSADGGAQLLSLEEGESARVAPAADAPGAGETNALLLV